MQPLNFQAASQDERRAHPRSPCSLECAIAPFKPGGRLAGLQFELARLNDISLGGFSFWANRWPNLAELAFVLADKPGAAVFLSEVRHVRRVSDRYIIGCQIVRLLANSAGPLVGACRYARLLPRHRKNIAAHGSSSHRVGFQSTRLTQIELSGLRGDGNARDIFLPGPVAREFAKDI